MINVQKYSPNLLETKIPIRIAVEPIENHFDGLKILIDEHKLHFASVDDFSFAIESRTSISAQQYEEILRAPRENLWRSAKTLKDNEKSLIGVLEASLKDPTSVKGSVQRLGIEIFRHEHQWREIFGALLRREDVDEYLKTALVKSMG